MRHHSHLTIVLRNPHNLLHLFNGRQSVIGICWGQGTTLLVTPDIVAGDMVMVTFEDNSYNSMIVPDAESTSYTLVDSTITVGGTIGALVSRVNFEERILNPR